MSTSPFNRLHVSNRHSVSSKRFQDNYKNLKFKKINSAVTAGRGGKASYSSCTNNELQTPSVILTPKSMNMRKNLKNIIYFINKEYLEENKYVLLNSDKLKTQKSGLIFCGYLKGNLRKNGALPNTEHLSRVHKQPNRIYHINGVNPTLSSSEGSGRYYIYDEIGVRKLTIDECFKIMGFPENYILHNKSNVNYSQIGNAVSPVLIENIYK